MVRTGPQKKASRTHLLVVRSLRSLLCILARLSRLQIVRRCLSLMLLCGIRQRGIRQRGIRQRGIRQRGIRQRGIRQRGIGCDSTAEPRRAKQLRISAGFPTPGMGIAGGAAAHHSRVCPPLELKLL